ncbi:MAG: ABC transporter permease [Bacillota bacterium]|nr:ABC transporter permease [Bacillota bacterium]
MLKGWPQHLRALGAIFRKDLQVFMSYPVNAVMRILEPLMWMTPVYFMARSFAVDGVNIGLRAYTGTTDYVAFFVLGAAISSYVSAVFWGMGFALKNEMDTGVLESNWLTPAPLLVQMLGRSLFSLFLTTVNMLMIGCCVWLLFGFEFTGRVLPALLTVAPLLVALYGFGLGLAGVVLITNNANNIIDLVSNNITILSGAHFPVTVLPRPLLAISLALPLTYAYDAVRGQLLGTTTLMPIAMAQAILVAFMFVTVTAGLIVFGRIQDRCRQMGTLAHH